ncbi:MAG: hypothetical protein H0T84_05175 [Tatlockia sp.]|nr:hypothetical protein [Tatlockia sp.]
MANILSYFNHSFYDPKNAVPTFSVTPRHRTGVTYVLGLYSSARDDVVK